MLDYASVNFLHFAVLLFVVCSAILVGVSLVTAAPPPEKLAGLTFGGGRISAREPAAERRVNIVLSAALVACVAGIWLYFA